MLSTTSRAPGLPRDVGDRGDVGDAQQRVGRRLAPDDAGGRPHRRAQGVDVAEVDRGVLDAPRREDLVDQPERAAVGVVRDDDVVAGAQEHPQQHVARAHARAERAGVPAALQRGQALLQRGAGGVRAARVLVAAGARAADAVLGEGGRQVQGGDHRARGGVGFLPGMDRVRGEAAHDPHATRPGTEAGRPGRIARSGRRARPRPPFRCRGTPARPSGSRRPRACRRPAPARRPPPRTPTSPCRAARSPRSWAAAATCAAPAGPSAARGR